MTRIYSRLKKQRCKLLPTQSSEQFRNLLPKFSPKIEKEARAVGASSQAVAITQCCWTDVVIPAGGGMGWPCGRWRCGRELTRELTSPVCPRVRGEPSSVPGLWVDQQLQQAQPCELPGCAGTSSESSYPEFSRSPLFVAVKTQTSQSSKKSPASINRCSGLLHRSPPGVPPASQSQMFRAPNSGSAGSKAITGTHCLSAF